MKKKILLSVRFLFFKPKSKETAKTSSLPRPEASNPLAIKNLNDIHSYNDADFQKLIDSLVEIEEIAFSNHHLKFSRTTFTHELRHSTRRLNILISEDHLNTIYGYCLYEIEENDKIYISSLCVDPKYSGHHYGFKLLQQAMSEFSKVTDQQNFAISLNCDKSMTSYYEKVGFERVEFQAKENIEMETSYQQLITQCNQKLQSLTVFPANPTL